MYEAQAKTVLTDTLEIIPSAAHWIKRNMALDINGSPVASMMPDACKFCLLGGIVRATNQRLFSSYLHTSNQFEVEKRAIAAVMSVINEQMPDRRIAKHGDVIVFNDHAATTYDEVRSVVEAAITSLEREVSDAVRQV